MEYPIIVCVNKANTVPRTTCGSEKSLSLVGTYNDRVFPNGTDKLGCFVQSFESVDENVDMLNSSVIFCTNIVVQSKTD